MFYRKITQVLFLSLFIYNFVVAQSGDEERPTAQAMMMESDPVIDGDILNEAFWKKINPISELIQQQPNNGNTPTEKTEIRIAYTSKTLYVGVVCYDSTPDQLVVSDARRDASLNNADAIKFILDTYHDGRNGFVFGTNSVGIEYDAQVDNEGQGNFNQNRQQGGMIGGFNLNWDGSWEVKTEVGDYGWSAEFAIPFRTIRFTGGKDKTWGFNFQRNIRKNNEIVFWSSLPLSSDLNRLSLAGDLTSLNIKTPKNLKLIPYVLGQATTDYSADPNVTKLQPEVGLDLKYSLTPSMTLDLTYNTDFAQVEVDEQQVNLDRFNLFFPEKRPFFLENAGLFSVGSPGEVDLFFSRRIGIGTDGTQVPIIGGARVSGKMKNTNIGLLSMFTGEVESESIDRTNFTVARVNHEFQGTRSALGGVFINRQGLGDVDDDFNRTMAVDGKLGLGKKAQISAFFANTVTPGEGDAEHAFQIETRYNWDGWRINGGYTEVGKGFNPEVGFLGRRAFRKVDALVFKVVRAKEESKYLESRPHVSYRGYWDFDGFMETSFLHVDNHWVWKNGIEVHTGINFTTQGVAEEFEISDGVMIPANSYNHSETQIIFFTNQSKKISVSTFSVFGGFFSGKRYSNGVTLRVRAGDKFNSEFGYIRNDIRLPFGDFNADIFRARLSYSFTPRIFTQALVQFNSVSDKWSANVRFGWLDQANSGLFLVYNETRGGTGIEGRSFIVKYSRVFDVFK